MNCSRAALHTHSYEHEVFVIEGQGVFVYEGKEYPFNSDYAIFVPGGKQVLLQKYRPFGFEISLYYSCSIRLKLDKKFLTFLAENVLDFPLIIH